MIQRTALSSLSVAGHGIPAGAMFMLCNATANRDPRTWQAPERFDVARFASPGTARLMVFGAGPHYCLGAALARVTLEECLRAVVMGDERFELAEEPCENPWRVVLGRSPVRLRVTTGHPAVAVAPSALGGQRPRGTD